jgi:amidase
MTLRAIALLVCSAPFALNAQQELASDSITALPLLEIRQRLAAGTLSAERVTSAFLERIESLDDRGPQLTALIEINPDAMSIARDLDNRFARSGIVGPLHGVPVVVKANVDTADRMATSAGSLALANHHAVADAPVVERLRAAGAVLLAKANLSEWARFRAGIATSGWSSLGGQTRNPYVLDRNPCGSSSGSAVAVAARLAPLAIGTETNGSIICPAATNGVVGIKPTIGLVSQRGIIPIARSQDTAGPLAPTVRDAALLLAVISDAASRREYSIERKDLRGVRLGVVRDYVGAGREVAVEEAYSRVLDTLRAAGGDLVDPLNLDLGEGVQVAQISLLLYEFKDGINAYLRNVRAGAPRSLAELIDFNSRNASTVMPHFGQDLLIAAEQHGTLEEPAYREAVRGSTEHVRTLVERAFDEGRLDALVAPANGPAWRTDWATGDQFGVSSSSIAAISGYPSVTVPAELAGELPLGVVFIGKPFEEQLLLEIAAAFESERGAFPGPRYLTTVEP